MICCVAFVFVLFFLFYFVVFVEVDLLFFFYLLVYVYLFQFFFVFNFSYYSEFVRVVPGFIARHLGFLVGKPLSYMVVGFYFFFMLFICYTGHFSWNLALGRVIDFVVVWAVIG